MSSDERNAQAYRAVSGRSPRTEPKPAPTVLDFHQSLNLLYGRVKSQNRLADMLGVPRRTLRRWLGGETPSRTGADRVRREQIEESAKRLIKVDDQAATTAVRRGRLSLAREAKIRGARTVHVTAWMRYGSEPEPRDLTFHIGSDGSDGLADWAADAVVDAYLDGATPLDGPHVQNEGIFAPLVEAMTDDKYQEMFKERAFDALAFDVEKVTFS